VVYRIRLIEPISADFAVLVGDAIRNVRRVRRAAEAISGRSREDAVGRSQEG
jgi:hypothetical protein